MRRFRPLQYITLGRTRKLLTLLALFVISVGAIGLWGILELKRLALEGAANEFETTTVHPFPVGVDQRSQLITEQPNVEFFYSSQLAATQRVRLAGAGWWPRLVREISHVSWWQSLASPQTRVLVIWPGERKEQVIDNFGDILGWNTAERNTFQAAVTSSTAPLPDGIFYPGTYVVMQDASPEVVAREIADRFTTEILQRYPTPVAEQVSLRNALTIASLLERESYDFEEMRTIAGVIWHRLFIDMPLQLDASLQYVKGSRPTGPWWPAVRPADKFISSPYNTYENTGLPPAPIANPSAAAILAALNPRDTKCRFYFHGSDGAFYCSVTYQEHVEALRRIYGQGK